MAENFESAASNLSCSENSSTCINGFDCDGVDDDENCQNHAQNSPFDQKRSLSLVGCFSFQSEETLTEMAVKELELSPRHDYLNRFRTGELDLSVRREALHWILKAHAHHGFGPMSFCLSMNYLDRFQSVYELPKGESWTGQLLAVACLSLAAKMEEADVPRLIELQVGEPKYVFEAKTIQRMELLVLATLKWRLHCLTPCSFVGYFLTKINELGGKLNAVIDFLEFKPSEVAAAVAITASGNAGDDVQQLAQYIDKAVSCFVHAGKERVWKCVELMKDLWLMNGSASVFPWSPDGVLDGARWSYNDTTSTPVDQMKGRNTVRSHAISSQITATSPSDIICRRKQQDTTVPSSSSPSTPQMK